MILTHGHGDNGGNDMMAEGDGFRLTYSSQNGLK